MQTATDITQALDDEFRSLSFLRDSFPMLTDWAVKDESVLIHSLGCNYLAALGRHLGFWAINECPFRVSGGNTIRPDAVWWNKDDRQVMLLAEFERYQAGQDAKLQAKAKNLVETYASITPKPVVALLLTWVFTGTDLKGARSAGSVAYNGFAGAGKSWIGGMAGDHRFLHYFAIFGREGGNTKLLRIQA
jgi:hypothetical protein